MMYHLMLITEFYHKHKTSECQRNDLAPGELVEKVCRIYHLLKTRGEFSVTYRYGLLGSSWWSPFVSTEYVLPFLWH